MDAQQTTTTGPNDADFLIEKMNLLGVLFSMMIYVMLLALITTGCTFVPQIASLGSNLWTDISTAPGIAYLTLSLSINTILTFLIVGRILYIGRRLRCFGPRYGQYTSVVALIIESAALYTFWALISVIACGVNSPLQFALLPALGQVQAIPPLLILTRVASGRALAKDTYSSLSVRTGTGVRFSTSIDTLPPYSGPDKDRELLGGRSPSFKGSMNKPPITLFEPATSKPHLARLDLGAWTQTYSDHSLVTSATSPPIESPRHVYFPA
ncbi:hypothetical protein EIP91_009906 [Steccherinum ochraceum]|uniref:Uncharacterized protein n=1 Tax=Steccherinum ochraceum TaxID=92696 RepID=A0A4R0RJF3_9APHY|nr:hypothetical protein EIP91_009906 [Steccherinum ochraceum]